MKKRLWLIGLLAGASLVMVISILVGLRITRMRDPSSLKFYLLSWRPHELPTELIRPAFRLITGQDLPNKADNLRAILEGGRGAEIFVSFETDLDGIAYIERTFTVPGASFEPVDQDKVESLKPAGYPFTVVSYWQEKYGLCICDLNYIKSGRELQTGHSPHIFIDDHRNTVYIHARF
jgi:hypothetical protein